MVLPNDDTIFKVDPRPDAGGFAGGDSAPIAWDVLRRTGRHNICDVIDLSGCKHLKPYTLACLCSIGELGKHNNRPIRVIPPQDSVCADHLARLGVPDFFEGDWASQPERESNLHVQRITWPPGDIAERLVEILAPRTGLPPGVFPRLVENLDEVIVNALTHAHSPVDCIVAGQAFDGTDKVEFAVLDLGQTIRSHLCQNSDYAGIASDDLAILKATEDGVTGTPRGQKNSRGEDNSGAGLAELRTYCESGGGELTMLSGRNWVTCQQDADPVIGTIYRGFRGCLVNIRFFTRIPLSETSIQAIL